MPLTWSSNLRRSSLWALQTWFRTFQKRRKILFSKCWFTMQTSATQPLNCFVRPFSRSCATMRWLSSRRVPKDLLAPFRGPTLRRTCRSTRVATLITPPILAAPQQISRSTTIVAIMEMEVGVTWIWTIRFRGQATRTQSARTRSTTRTRRSWWAAWMASRNLTRKRCCQSPKNSLNLS